MSAGIITLLSTWKEILGEAHQPLPRTQVQSTTANLVLWHMFTSEKTNSDHAYVTSPGGNKRMRSAQRCHVLNAFVKCGMERMLTGGLAFLGTRLTITGRVAFKNQLKLRFLSEFSARKPKRGSRYNNYSELEFQGISRHTIFIW